MEHEIEVGFMEWLVRLVWRELKVWHGVWGAWFRGWGFGFVRQQTFMIQAL